MHKSLKVPVAMLAAAALFTACKKEDRRHHEAASFTKVVNVALTANESYTKTVTVGDADDVPTITQAAKHAASVSITNTGNTGTLNYMPATGYMGTDSVMVAPVEGPHTGNMPGGRCGGGHGGGSDVDTSFLFVFTMGGGSQ